MLKTLSITHCRNISNLRLTLSPKFNVLLGKNGCGKTSILEGIHYLALARSFRTHLASRAIQENQNALSVYGELTDGTTLGVMKGRNGLSQVKLNGESTAQSAELAKSLPLQLVDPQSYRLLEGGPKARRQFMDWAVFHVEHAFFQAWRQYRRALKHRNAALKQQLSTKEVAMWDPVLIDTANEMDAMREKTLAAFTVIFNQMISELLPYSIDIRYIKGWKGDLLDCFAADSARDTAMGYTQSGPHRADLRVNVNGKPAIDVLSRGQQKLLVSALHLSQGKLLQQFTGQTCLYLIDDFNAELDSDNQQLLLTQLSALNAQVILATTDSRQLSELTEGSGCALFHVEPLIADSQVIPAGTR